MNEVIPPFSKYLLRACFTPAARSFSLLGDDGQFRNKCNFRLGKCSKGNRLGNRTEEDLEVGLLVSFWVVWEGPLEEVAYGLSAEGWEWIAMGTSGGQCARQRPRGRNRPGESKDQT